MPTLAHTLSLSLSPCAALIKIHIKFNRATTSIRSRPHQTRFNGAGIHRRVSLCLQRATFPPERTHSLSPPAGNSNNAIVRTSFACNMRATEKRLYDEGDDADNDDDDDDDRHHHHHNLCTRDIIMFAQKKNLPVRTVRNNSSHPPAWWVRIILPRRFFSSLSPSAERSAI